MAASFNGSTSDLSATVSSTAITYPVLMTGWMKPAAATASMAVVALSDNGGGGSLDALALAARGDVGSDPVRAEATAAGSSSTSAAIGFSAAGTWQFVAALFTSPTSRKVKIKDNAWSTPETTERNVADFTRVSIGSLLNSGVTAPFNGLLAEVAIWTGFDADHADLAVAQVYQGVSPQRIWHQPAPYLWQPLRSAENQRSIGPSLTATNVTFDATDDPFASRSSDRAADHGGGRTDPDVAAYRWPDSGSTPGPLLPNRICVLDEDQRIQLAAADSANWAGCTERGHVLWHSQYIILRSAGWKIGVEMASGASFTVGESEAFLAADGKVDDAGTIPIGIVGGVRTNKNLAEVIPY